MAAALLDAMFEVGEPEKTFSFGDEADLYDPVEFDPETSSADEEIDSDTLAFRDAVRDIVAAEGRFEVSLPL